MTFKLSTASWLPVPKNVEGEYTALRTRFQDIRHVCCYVGRGWGSGSKTIGDQLIKGKEIPTRVARNGFQSVLS